MNDRHWKYCVMVSYAGAQQLKDFEGVYLSGRDSTHPIPIVLKIEQISNGVKFTEYKIYSFYSGYKDPVVQARTYSINGKYVKDAKEQSKMRAAFKRHKLRIDTVKDWSSISIVLIHGIRTKRAEEWSLAPDLQTLTLRIRDDVQSMQIPYDGGDNFCRLEDTYCMMHDNERSTKTGEQVYRRRGLLSAALAEATEKN